MARLVSRLMRWLGIAFAFLAVLSLGLYLWFPHPSRDPALLRAIAAESRALIAAHPIKPPEQWMHIPQSQLPPTIASLHPYSVAVFRWGLDISTDEGMDLGWGYGVPRDEAARKELLDWCYREAGEGVLWHDQC